MRYAAVILLLAFVGRLSAQRTDTLFYKGGAYKYAVYHTDHTGKVIGSYAYYDHSDVLKFKAEAKRGKWNGTFIQYYANGGARTSGKMKKGVPTGIWTHYDENGRKRSEAPYRKGEFDGVIKTYYPNGRIKSSKPYKKGKLYGERIIWDSTGTWMNGDVLLDGSSGIGVITSHCLNGRPEGKVTVTRMDGCLDMVGQYKNGLADGEFIIHDKNETPIRKDRYKDGRFVSGEELNAN